MHSIRIRVVALAAALFAVLSAIALPVTPAAEPAEAAVGSQFDPGYIISDANFYKGNAMSAAQVQSFLDAQQPGCRAGYTCLNRYSQATPSMAADRYCNAVPGMANGSAAQIIAAVGSACGISQRVLIVLLQKEQSLITSTAPPAYAYNSATGFGCPDTAPCDQSFGGFFYQVYYAARQFEVYRLNPSSFGYRPGVTNSILWHPNSACGRSNVFIQNSATAGLYIYTPYRPNAAALANLYGTGDSCSSYGNRNFWRMYTDWFGNPLAGGEPIGQYESVSIQNNVVTVRGWALDPDTADAVQIHAYAGLASSGRLVSQFTANQARADVGAAYPNAGANHGFTAQILVPSGTSQICLYAIDTAGEVANPLLGCRSFSPEAGTPMGRIDSLSVDGTTATFRGWSLDPDSTAPVEMNVYLGGRYGEGGRFAGRIVADDPRGDINTAFGLGANHGFAGQVTIPVGTTQMCVYGLNLAGYGAHSVECRQVTSVGGPPIGNFESIVGGAGAFTIKGWAIDPDVTAPVQLAVSVDGGAATTITANVARTDVQRAYPSFGANHGFNASMYATAGQHQVCVTAINVGTGANVSLGCRTVTVAAGDPRGQFESATLSGTSAVVRGWAIDPNTTDPLQVHVYVNGRYALAATANQDRPDVARVYPAQGADVGYQVNVPLGAGSNQICVYAINVPAGNNPSLGCRTVNV